MLPSRVDLKYHFSMKTFPESSNMMFSPYYLFIFKIIYAIQREVNPHGRFVIFIFVYPGHMS